MTELEKLHQLLLFTLLDVEIPSYTNYITIDGDGLVTYYKNLPEIDVDNSVWRTGSTHEHIINNRWSIAIHPLTHKNIIINEVSTCNWQECIWKI